MGIEVGRSWESSQSDQPPKSYEGLDLGYKYPGGKNFIPGSPLSTYITGQIKEYRDQCRSFMSKYKDIWKQMEYTRSAYMPKSESDAKRDSRDSRRPTTIVIPATLANTITYRAHMWRTFVKDPMHMYYGIGSPEAAARAALLERLVRSQDIWFRNGLAIDAAIDDSFTYGRGLLHVRWSKVLRNSTRIEELSEILALMLRSTGMNVDAQDLVRYQIENDCVFEGSELERMDPNHTWVSPHVAANNVQSAQFIGFDYIDDSLNLLAKERDPEEQLFNAQHVRMMTKQGDNFPAEYMTDEGSKNDKTGGGIQDSIKPPYSDACVVSPWYFTCVPSEWGIADSNYPTTYLITVVNDAIVVQCHEVDLHHGQKPVLGVAPFDWNEPIPYGYMQSTLEQQRYIDWATKTDMDNIWKALNDMLVVNTHFIHHEDIKNPGPGKLIRLKENASLNPIPIDNIIKQLNVQDITQGNMMRASTMLQLQRIMLGTDNLITSGDMSAMPEKMGSQGASMAFGAGLNKMDYFAGVIAMQTMYPLAYQMAYNTIQLMSVPRQTDITGRYERLLRSKYGLPPDQSGMLVDPDMLDTNFQILPSNGALPQRSNPAAYTEILKTLLASSPEVGMQLLQELGGSILPVFLEWAKINAADSINELTAQMKAIGPALPPQILPDQQVADMQATGALQPV